MTRHPTQMAIPLLEALGPIASVTCAERRMYAWLLGVHWKHVAERVKEPWRLQIEFWGGTQLAVSWTGDVTSKRRTVMVAHTDREGFLLSNITRRVAGSLDIEGRHCDVRTAIEEHRVGARVVIIANDDGGARRSYGIIKEINRTLSGEVRDASVVVQVRGEDGHPDALDDLETALRMGDGRVTAHYKWASAPEHGEFDIQDGKISAWALDNAVGVAVATTVLTRFAENGEKVNATVLYTTGEEEGFTGLLSVVKEEKRRLASNARHWLWLVIDCSSREYSRRVSMDEWRRVRLDGPDARMDNAFPTTWQEMVSLSSAAVRLEDKGSLFDLSVCRMLWQAALESRSARTAREGGENAGGDSHEAEMGVFVGGFCEAGILCHLRELLREAGGSMNECPLVGCIAVPIENYRAIARKAADVSLVGGGGGNSEGWEIGPEVARAEAVEGAVELSEQACRMHGTYVYPESTYCGDRTGRRSERIAMWSVRMRSQEWESLEALSRWLKGAGVLKRVRDK